MSQDTSSEAWRHECECRYWLDAGYTTKSQMDELMKRITANRGRAAAERLREGMRQAYAVRPHRKPQDRRSGAMSNMRTRRR